MKYIKLASAEKNKDTNTESVSKKAMKRTLIGDRIPGAGYFVGRDSNHGAVGFFLGGSGVNGALAKDTGKSRLKESALSGAALGTGLGMVAHKMRGGGGSLKGYLASGLAAGAKSGLTAAAAYGLGHQLGQKQKQKKGV